MCTCDGVTENKAAQCEEKETQMSDQWGLLYNPKSELTVSMQTGFFTSFGFYHSFNV